MSHQKSSRLFCTMRRRMRRQWGRATDASASGVGRSVRRKSRRAREVAIKAQPGKLVKDQVRTFHDCKMGGAGIDSRQYL
jgi:hypothetical protein